MYFIDVLYRLKDENAILLKGWAFDETNKKPAKIEVEADEPIEKFIVKSKYREDVLDSYGLDYNEEYGFIMKIALKELKGKVKIIFKDLLGPGQDEVLELDLDKKYCYPKEYRLDAKLLAKKAINKGKKLLQSGNGARYVLNSIKKQLPGIDPVYETWIRNNEIPRLPKYYESIVKNLKYKPLISIIVPVYNVDITWLRKMIESVEAQTYPYWELCIADDNSTDPNIRKFLERAASENPKIKVVFREKNGNISKATNSAFKLATGEFIGLLDNDDELAPNALLENVLYINEHPDVDMIYSDEDKIDTNGIRKDPYFKPDFSPDSILSNNYICHFLLFRRSLFENEQLMRSEYDGAQDHDLILRIAEKTDKIGHIPKILYHWRTIPSSTAQSAGAKEYIVDAGVRAIEDALKRRGLEGTVTATPYGGFYEVEYTPDINNKVSVIIPTKNNAGDIRNVVQSIVDKTTYPNYEIVIVDNGSDDPEAVQAFIELETNYPEYVRVLHLPIPFNYSRINNRAAEFATGDFYLFLNDDTEVITKGWMTKMLGYAQQPWIGCVGAKLYYPDDTVQHAGVVMGILGIAGHVFNRYPKDIPGYFGRMMLNVNYTAVTAACLMIQRDKFWEVGGFDEEIAVSFNDVDLCCKVAFAGYYNIYLGSVELYHYESKSRGYETTPDKMLRFDKERGRIVRKWRNYINRDPMYNPNLTLLRGDYTLDPSKVDISY